MSKVRIIGGLSAAAALAAATLIMPFEGRSLVTYLDPPGVATICDGETEGVELGQVATELECDEMLRKNLRKREAALDKLIKVPVSNKTKAAFLSFSYNIGVGNFSRSTALRKLNAGDTIGSCEQMLRWIYSGGKPLAGLQRRRIAERKLCLEGAE